MKTNQHYTPEEIEYIDENWGIKPIDRIVKNLRRTKYGILKKGYRMGLGKIYSNDFNANEIAKILNKSCDTIIAWIKKGSLKGRKLSLRDSGIWWQVNHDDLMDWLKNNPDKYNARNIKPYALGYEPEWLKEYRNSDNMEPRKHWRRWTEEDNKNLITMFHKGYEIKELAIIFERTEKSIKTQISEIIKSLHSTKSTI